MGKLTVYIVVGTVITIILNFIFLIFLGRLFGALVIAFSIFIPILSATVLFLCLTPTQLSMNEKLKVAGFSLLLSLVSVPLFKVLTIFVQGSPKVGY